MGRILVRGRRGFIGKPLSSALHDGHRIDSLGAFLAQGYWRIVCGKRGVATEVLWLRLAARLCWPNSR